MTVPSMRIAGIGTRGVPSHYSGLESSCEGLYVALAARGHRMTVYCRPGWVDGRVRHYRGIELIHLPTVRARSLETLTHVAASLGDAAVRGRFDVLHLHAEAPGLFAPLIARAGTPIVATIQGLDWQRAKWKGNGSRLLRTAERWLAAHAAEIIVVSRALQEHFLVEHGRRTTYIPNGVGEPAAVSDAARLLAPWGLRVQGYVLYAGRLVPEKRIEDLIRAFAAVETPLRLAIAGGAGYSEDYAAHLHALAAADPRVVFTGGQHGRILHALFQAAALYVLPSEMEGLPMSLLEAMVQGTPAAVSDIPPHRELLGGIAGYDLFFAPRDVDGLAHRLRQALAELDGYRAIAERVQALTRQSYGWEAAAEATEQLFFRVVEEARQRTGVPRRATG